MTPGQIENLRRCQEAGKLPQVQAFKAVIRRGEGTEGERGYSTIVGGSQLSSFADHPRKRIKVYGVESTAAGVAQFLAGTWDECVQALGLPDFTPTSQELAFTWLIIGKRKALEALLEEDLAKAIRLCNREWASLPGSPYGQPVMTMAEAERVWTSTLAFLKSLPLDQSVEQRGEDGGDQQPEPQRPAQSPPSTPRPIPAEELVMSPFLPIALDAIFQVVPKLAKEFGSGSDVAKRNAKAATVIVEAAKGALNAANEQDIVEKLATDAEAVSLVREAVQKVYFEITEVGGGISAAREANASYLVPGAVGFYHNPAFWISGLFVLMVFMILVDMLFIHADSYAKDGLRTQIVTAVLALVSGVSGYWLGSSMQASNPRRATDLTPPAPQSGQTPANR